MNDLDLVRSMRADAPAPSQERLDEGRERLLSSVLGQRPVRADRRRPLGRFRGALLIGAVAAMTMGVTVTVQVGQRDELRQGPTTPNTSSATRAAERTTVEDALLQRASFGWLPDGLRTTSYTYDRRQPDLPSFQILAMRSKEANPNVALTAYEAGKEPPLEGRPSGTVHPERSTAPPVNGRSAHWVRKPTSPNQPIVELRWQYAPNSWAVLEAIGLDGTPADLTRTVYRIAESAKLGGSRRFSLPVRVDGLPEGLTPSIVGAHTGPEDDAGARLALSDDERPGALDITLSRSIGSRAWGTMGNPHPNTTLGRHRAHRAEDSLHVYGVNGFDVTIQASGSFLSTLDQTGGLVGLFQQTTVLGLDQSKWTTDPVN